ncbi:hypothetical protein CWI38_0401p0020 [Hamiltosporidium tvaerminnensis]|uniref:Uncharacterized protein n=1 Tax=Hamiltosporidium tvaerminnensis TaxID=1176355 RepID=A0A4Q9LXL9_9MICR|nr:hypothetical protein CWI38_0475p0020 [Hamiltosporidium tvaerminnensis]TBU13539.1 hypothetical protein CWI38_0401p0020 [Hamiltosporidium tvaerminnensis]
MYTEIEPPKIKRRKLSVTENNINFQRSRSNSLGTNENYIFDRNKLEEPLVIKFGTKKLLSGKGEYFLLLVKHVLKLNRSIDLSKYKRFSRCLLHVKAVNPPKNEHWNDFIAFLVKEEIIERISSGKFGIIK